VKPAETAVATDWVTKRYTTKLLLQHCQILNYFYNSFFTTLIGKYTTGIANDTNTPQMCSLHHLVTY